MNGHGRKRKSMYGQSFENGGQIMDPLQKLEGATLQNYMKTRPILATGLESKIPDALPSIIPASMSRKRRKFEEGGQITTEQSKPAEVENPVEKKDEPVPVINRPTKSAPMVRGTENVTGLAAVDQKTYNSIKDIPITRLTVVRSPVKPAIVTVLNVLSLGQLKSISNKLGYDALFHLALKVTLNNGKSYRVEKNQNISIKAYEDYPKTEAFGLPTVKQGLTLSIIMNASLKKEGASRFYTYDAFKNNCQMFVRSLLQSSGLLTPQAGTFISQNTEAVAKALPGYVAPIARTLTNIGAKADQLIQKFFGKKLFKQGGQIMA